MVSRGYDGSPANGRSYHPTISSDGLYVVFASDASNLLPGDTNGRSDVFSYDRLTCTLTLISVAADGVTFGNGDSVAPAVTSDGRYVAFQSAARNLLSAAVSTTWAIFLRDTQTNETVIISVAPDGSAADAQSRLPAISADGRYIAYQSQATNLTNDEDTIIYDIFLFDRDTNETIRVSNSYDGGMPFGQSERAAISADGRYVAYDSVAPNIIPDDTNSFMDVFVYDRTTGQTKRVSVSSSGAQNSGTSSNPALTADGQYITFSASGSLQTGYGGPYNVYLHDQLNGQTIQISLPMSNTQAGAESGGSVLSSDGNYVVYSSYANSLVHGDTNGATDIFRYDRTTGVTARLSLTETGAQANDGTFTPRVSANGELLTYWSKASNLVGGDTNSVEDVFLVNAPLLPPSAPVNLAATSPTNTQIDLTWQESGYNETHFQIERAPNGVDWVQIDTAPANATSYTNGGLSCNTLYSYRVRAFNSDNNQASAYSNAVTIRTQPCAPVQAGPIFTVNQTADGSDDTCSSDHCTLREAIIAANNYVTGRPTVIIPAGTYTLSLTGQNEDAAQSGDLDVLNSMTIRGAGVASTLIDGGAVDRIFHYLPNVTSTLSDLTIQNGYVEGTNNAGGALLADSGVALTIEHVHMRGNTAALGGAIGVGSATVTITESTFFDNT
ncbi:MAG: PD40 domain-containing protein, partial [Anaerolineae bacterium]|nr:PD40 domain-containing protein [Anaerolineae bacterium]